MVTLKNGTKVSYDKKTGSYNINGKNYSDKNSAKNALVNSGAAKNVNRGNSSFVDVSVEHDQHMGKTAEEIASKWGGKDEAGNRGSNTAGGQKVLQALNKQNRVYGTGGYTNYNDKTGLYDNPSISSTEENTPVGHYGDASYKNYTNAFNKYKEQGMDDATARSQAAKLLEGENLSKGKTDEEIATETQNGDEIDYDEIAAGSVLGGEGEETSDEPEEPNANEQTIWEEEGFDNLSDYIDYSINKGINDYVKNWESKNTQSNVVKETVPEEVDDTYNYNTYYNENLADQTPYEGGQTKDVQREGLTWASKYEEPVTNALQDLGLLSPNEQAAESMPNTLAPEGQPETFNSAEDIINSFDEAVGTGLEEGQIASPKDAVRIYQEYKRRLEKFVNDNKLSKEEYINFLNQMKGNEGIQRFLRNNNNQ